MMNTLITALQSAVSWFLRLIETVWAWSVTEINGFLKLSVETMNSSQKTIWFAVLAILVVALATFVWRFRHLLLTLWNSLITVFAALIALVLYALGAGVLSWLAQLLISKV